MYDFSKFDLLLIQTANQLWIIKVKKDETNTRQLF